MKLSHKSKNSIKAYTWAFITLGVICGAVGLVVHLTDHPTTANKPDKSVAGVAGDSQVASLSQFSVKGLLADTNQARKSNSLPPLTLNSKLDSSASAKCKDMVKRDYWSHNTPDGKEPWTFIQKAGYSYSYAGENLAYGFSTNNDTLKGWMNSAEHRANILSKSFTEVGFGFCKSNDYTGAGPEVIVVQHFGTPPTASRAGTSSNTGSSTFKPYIASVCTTTSIPYKTVYVNVSYLYVGQTTSYGGYNGSIKRCTADSTGYKPADLTFQPIDKTVNVGTKPNSSPPPPHSITYQQAQSNCLALGTGGSSAFEQCMHAYGY